MNTKRIKKIALRFLYVIIGVYILGCSYMYFFQESFLFFPDKLEKSHVFEFDGEFSEMTIKAKDGTKLNGVLFKTEAPKGLVFYLHGNAGSIQSCGKAATTYNDLGYDIFMLDYRGFGKSEGEIESQTLLFSDAQIAYNELKKKYNEKDIVVLGYSMGTGIAAHLASNNKPRKLILQAPYFSMIDMMQTNYPIVPTFLLNYKLETNNYIKKCRMPITIFHGDKDEVIPYNSSLRLKKLIKKGDKFFTLKGQLHNDIGENLDFLKKIPNVLKR